jgi:aminoglycoside/choline kinase family phosphotransferase
MSSHSILESKIDSEEISRKEAALKWIMNVLKKDSSFNINFLNIVKLPLEASNRIFYRFKIIISNSTETSIKSFILMDINPLSNSIKSIENFINFAGLFKNYNLNVPVIYSKNIENGFLIVSDLGELTYYDYIRKNGNTINCNISELYKSAINSLLKLQVYSKEDVLLKYNLDIQKIIMNWFIEWYLKEHCKLIDRIDKEKIIDIFSIIMNNLIEQLQVFVHNDYHSRNLIYDIANNNIDPGIVDFQDAILGPVCYDLASLLHDSYINLDESLISEMIMYYWENAKICKIKVNSNFTCFMKDFEYTSLQRCIKNIGVFSRLFYHSGNDKYMQYIPRLLERCKLICSKYSELTDLHEIIILCLSK